MGDWETTPELLKRAWKAPRRPYTQSSAFPSGLEDFKTWDLFQGYSSELDAIWRQVEATANGKYLRVHTKIKPNTNIPQNVRLTDRAFGLLRLLGLIPARNARHYPLDIGSQGDLRKRPVRPNWGTGFIMNGKVGVFIERNAYKYSLKGDSPHQSTNTKQAEIILMPMHTRSNDNMFKSVNTDTSAGLLINQPTMTPAPEPQATLGLMNPPNTDTPVGPRTSQPTLTPAPEPRATLGLMNPPNTDTPVGPRTSQPTLTPAPEPRATFGLMNPPNTDTPVGPLTSLLKRTPDPWSTLKRKTPSTEGHKSSKRLDTGDAMKYTQAPTVSTQYHQEPNMATADPKIPEVGTTGTVANTLSSKHKVTSAQQARRVVRLGNAITMSTPRILVLEHTLRFDHRRDVKIEAQRELDQELEPLVSMMSWAQATCAAREDE